MISDNLINVIAGLVKREGRIAREDAKKAKEALKAEAEKDEEEDDEEEPEQKPEQEPEPKSEPKPEKDKEKDKEDDDGYDNKPSGPDPTLVAQVAAIVKQEIKDEEKEKKEKEVKLSGKKEKIDTTPTMKQEGTRMNFREAVKAAVTGTSLAEGYESQVLKILDDEGIVGPLGYDPFFEKGRLFVQKGSESKAKKALKDSRELKKLPKIVGESIEFMLEAGYIKQKPNGMWCVYNDDNEIVKEFKSVEEAGRFLETELNDSGDPVGESVDVDGRCKGFKEALRRLTYEKIRQMKEKEKVKKEEIEIDEVINFGKMSDKKLKAFIAGFDSDEPMGQQAGMQLKAAKKEAKKRGIKEEVEIEEEGEYTSYWMPEGLSKEGAAEFMAAASAAKRNGDKKFKFGDKEYPVTIKVDIPLKKEEVEVDESNELQAIMALDDEGIEAELNKKGEVVVKKKDLKKAEKALKKSFRKGGQPKLVGEEIEVEEGADKDTKGDKEAYQKFFKATLKKFGVDEPDQLKGDKKKEFFDAIDKGWKADNEKPEPGDKKEEVEDDEEIDEKKMSVDAKLKQQKRRRKYATMGKKSPDKKYAIGAKKRLARTGHAAKDVRRGRKQAKAAHKAEFIPTGDMIDEGEKQFSAFDKIRGIWKKLNEGLDRHAVQELKLYIENDRDLYRQQTVSIIKNIQKKMKSGKYEHLQAPKLWMYLVDNGAKKYVKEFGGDVKNQFPKDVRHSVAVEFANEYRAEIEAQGGEML